MKLGSAWLGAFAVALVQFTTGLPAAETFPRKPVRLMTAYPPGSGIDAITREFGARLSELLGRSMVIDHRPGAGGTLAMQAVARAPADGHTLLLATNAWLAFRHARPDAPHDLVADFAPVTRTGAAPMFLVVRADSSFTTLQDLVSRARSMPGKLNHGVGPVGSPAHLAAQVFTTVTGIKAVAIPGKPGTEFPLNLLRDDVQFATVTAPNAIPYFRSGKVRALGVTSSARLPEFPDVPTLKELLGDELLVQEVWEGLFAPAGTPPAVVRKLHAVAVKALFSDASRGFWSGSSESPEAFAAYVRQENEKMREIVRRTQMPSY